MKFKARVDSLQDSMTKILAAKRGTDEEGKPKVSPETRGLEMGVDEIFRILAKYQTVDTDDPETSDEFDISGMSPHQVEEDKVRLVAFSTNVMISAAKARAAAKYFIAKGKEFGAKKVATEKSAIEAEGGKFVATTAKYTYDAIKGEYEARAAENEAEAEALAAIADRADSMVQVLKKVHERMVREMMMMPGA